MPHALLADQVTRPDHAGEAATAVPRHVGHHHGRQRALGGGSAACRAARDTGAASRPCARTVRAAIDIGIGHLTLFSFSSENWSRPPDEVDFLFGLFRLYIRRDRRPNSTNAASGSA